MGVRAGGCSGMSYIMDMMKPEDQVEEGDTEVVYDGVRCVIDPKSLLFLYGLKLDYSDALIGGGFSFFNPNADETCGCGKSFGV
jgi:iron-sulfur cluster assembly accessory protein